MIMFRLLCWFIEHTTDAAARVLRGPRKLTFTRDGDRLVLDLDPSGERLGWRANVPWLLRRQLRQEHPVPPMPHIPLSLSDGRRARAAGYRPLPMPDTAELLAAIERGQRRARDNDR